MCSRNIRYSGYRTVCFNERSIYKEWAWLHRNVLINKSSNISSKDYAHNILTKSQFNIFNYFAGYFKYAKCNKSSER